MAGRTARRVRSHEGGHPGRRPVAERHGVGSSGGRGRGGEGGGGERRGGCAIPGCRRALGAGGPTACKQGRAGRADRKPGGACGRRNGRQDGTGAGPAERASEPHHRCGRDRAGAPWRTGADRGAAGHHCPGVGSGRMRCSGRSRGCEAPRPGRRQPRPARRRARGGQRERTGHPRQEGRSHRGHPLAQRRCLHPLRRIRAKRERSDRHGARGSHAVLDGVRGRGRSLVAGQRPRRERQPGPAPRRRSCRVAVIGKQRGGPGDSGTAGQPGAHGG